MEVCGGRWETGGRFGGDKARKDLFWRRVDDCEGGRRRRENGWMGRFSCVGEGEWREEEEGEWRVENDGGEWWMVQERKKVKKG